jgi:RNA polymerase sigma-70 factor (ECF subfamily)
MEMLDNLFRRESGRMISVLAAVFGLQNLSVAEDLVQEAFCKAIQVWPYSGVPDNPSAWLMATAKNKALDLLRRERTARRYAPEFGRLLESEWTLSQTLKEQFEPNAIQDDLLRMMFSCCHPRLPEPAQVGLMLHILCGFSIREVAGAFVSEHAAMEKRMQRAKKTLSESERLLDIRSPKEVATRAPAVLRALYLLFNEGYHGCSEENVTRAELCREAMRLTSLILEDDRLHSPAAHALLSLMCFDAARLEGRTDHNGDLCAFEDQDRTLWDKNLIQQGLALLDQSACGAEISEYHLEAAIAAVHCRASKAEETDWTMIVSLYDALMSLRPSPIVALNRAVAISRSQGPEEGLEAIAQIHDASKLNRYPFYFAARGEMAALASRLDLAKQDFAQAKSLARNNSEKRFLDTKIQQLLGPLV